MLTAHTRKVKTYGKSNTRVVNDRKAFSGVVSPTKNAISIFTDSENEENEIVDRQLPSKQPGRMRQKENVPLRPKVVLRPSNINGVNASSQDEEDQKQKPLLPSRTVAAKPIKAPLVPRHMPVKSGQRSNIRSEAPVSSSSASSFQSNYSSSTSGFVTADDGIIEEDISLVTVNSNSLASGTGSLELRDEAETIIDLTAKAKVINLIDSETEEEVIQPRRKKAGTRKVVTKGKIDSGRSSVLQPEHVSVTRTRAPKKAHRVVESPETSERSDAMVVILGEVDEDVNEPLTTANSGLRNQNVQRVPRSEKNLVEDVTEAGVSVARQELEDLTITPATVRAPSSPLQSLLTLCEQSTPYPFSDFIVSNDFTCKPSGSGRSSTSRRSSNQFRKVGEASYSEVFALRNGDGTAIEPVARPPRRGTRGKDQAPPIALKYASLESLDEIVLKVVPLRSTMGTSGGSDLGSIRSDLGSIKSDGDGEETIAFSTICDIKREIEITKAMSQVSEGFVNYYGAFIVKGEYPEVLLKSWDNFENEKGSQSVRPDCLGETQLYALIVLENAGIDLESFVFDKKTGWRQAWDTVLQVMQTLEQGEVKAKFEHRDLHEGQVLVKPKAYQNLDPAKKTTIESDYAGLKATIVDFGLSRVDLTAPDSPNKEVYSTPIPEDVFEGAGEQWDVYRDIRDLVMSEGKGDWAVYLPITNLLWLKHLIRVLLYSTPSLKKPKIITTARATASRAATRSSGPPAAKVQTDQEDEKYYKGLLNLETRLQEKLGGAVGKPRLRQKPKDTRKDLTRSGVTMKGMIDFARSSDW